MKMNMLAVFGGVVQAGTSYSSYSTTVGPFNGSGYTGYQVKSISGASGDLYSGTVGGSARRRASSGTGSWVRRVTANEPIKMTFH